MAKSKTKSAFVCEDCGAEHSKWQGQCGTCSAWNTLSRVNITPIANAAVGYAGVTAQVKKLSEIEALETPRIASGFKELDRVLGGGFVPGSVVLIGGDPGAGKSTLLLQACTTLAQSKAVLYVTGEESLQQLAMRAKRLNLPLDGLSVAAETRAEIIANLIEEQKPAVVILDSIQVMQMESVDSTPGSVTQVKETAAYFTRLAKQKDVVIVLVGHITKEGGIAGPKVLEFNVRFGDPETQVILPLLEDDLVPLLLASARGEALPDSVEFKNASAMVVVLASAGYPESYPKGEVISAPSEFPEGSLLIHAGTKLNENDQCITSGGRVLGAVGIGGSLQEARDRANAVCESVDFPSKYFRRDIGHREFSRA